MYHLVNNYQDKSGNALAGYYVKLKIPGGAYATLYADESGTPIVSVSGVADAAVTDSNGLFDIYVDEGDYEIEFFDKNDVNSRVGRVPSTPMYANTSATTALGRLASTDSGEGAALVVLEDGTDLQTAIAARPAVVADTPAVLIASADSYAVGARLRCGDGSEFEVVSSGEDVTTAGAVKLQAIADRSGYVTFRQLGAVGDASTDCRAAFLKAGGRKVRGTAGDTYFIDINAIADSIEILDGTDWDFPEGCTILWDAIQLPLFWSNDPDCTFRHVRPQIVYDGTPPATLPYATQGYFTPTLGGATSGAAGYYTTYYLSGIASGSLIRPKFSSLVPGAGKSIYKAIDLRPYDNAGTRGGTIYIESPEFDDIVFGIIGSGYNRLVVDGTVRGGRYDSYTNGTLSWGAPAHLIYFSDATGFNEVSMGDVWDAGIYQGNDTGNISAETFKSYRLANARIGDIVSFRPHGVLDGGGYQNCQIGNIFWRTDKDSADASWTTGAFRTSSLGGETGRIYNTKFGNVTLIYKTIGATAMKLVGTGDTAYPNTGISFGKVRIEGALSLSSSDQIVQLYNCDNVSMELETNLTGGAASDRLFRADSCDNVDLKVRNLGPTKLTSCVNASTLAANTNMTVEVDQVNQPTAFYQDEGDVAQSILRVSAPVKAGTFGFARITSTTAGAKTFTLPTYGYYEVVVCASGSGTNDVTQKFAVNWRASGLGSTQSIGSAFTNGTAISGVTCTLNNTTGVVTVTGNRGASGNVEHQVILVPYGAWTAYGA